MRIEDIGRDHNDLPRREGLDTKDEEGNALYGFSLDPDTKSAEKKLRRVVAKQVCHVMEYTSNVDNH